MKYKPNKIKAKLSVEVEAEFYTCVQQSMYENNKELWKVILELQTKLYDEFGIDE